MSTRKGIPRVSRRTGWTSPHTHTHTLPQPFMHMKCEYVTNALPYPVIDVCTNDSQLREEMGAGSFHSKNSNNIDSIKSRD